MGVLIITKQGYEEGDADTGDPVWYARYHQGARWRGAQCSGGHGNSVTRILIGRGFQTQRRRGDAVLRYCSTSWCISIWSVS